MKHVAWSSLLTALLGYAVVFWYLPNRSPLARYGVSYETETGESPSFNLAHFYLARRGRRIEGPVAIGDDLDVRFSGVGTRNVPDIEVRSGIDKVKCVKGWPIECAAFCRPELLAGSRQCYLNSACDSGRYVRHHESPDRGVGNGKSGGR